MPTYFQRPENALKRANEFIDVGKKQRALDALYDVIKSRRHRTWQKIHEPIMVKYLELCVELKKSHIAKEGLYQYKNISQQVNIKSLEDVVRGYLQLAEDKTEAARGESQQAVVDIDDLDNVQTPENLLLSAVSCEDSQDRTDRVVLTPWVKFLWESYRQCLELLRNNSRVERLYHDIAQQAFKFCLKYNRKTEFRKLCDNLRAHLDHIHKHQNQQTSVNLNNPESQAMHLETRLVQLESAIQMELWQEAYKAIEGIHGLMSLSKKAPKAQLMANYYQKLALVFWKAGNLLFHASALFRLFHLSREMRKNITPDEIQKMASRVVLATLAVPMPPNRPEIDRLVETDENVIDKNHRLLSTLLGLPSVPSRNALVKDLARFGVIQNAPSQIQDLYRWLEVEFHPLKLSSRVSQSFEYLQKWEEASDMKQYIPALQSVTIMRLLKEVSQVYQTIEFKRLLELASFASPFYLENIVVEAARRNNLQVRLDHRKQCLHFGSELSVSQREETVEGPHLQGMPSEQIRNQLVQLRSVLHKAVDLINPDKLEKQALREQIIAAYRLTEQKEHRRLLERQDIIEARKQMLETLSSQKEEEERKLLEEKQQKLKEAEEERMAKEAEERAKQRILREKDELKKKVVMEKIEALKKTELGARLFEGLEDEELERLDPEEIFNRQMEQMDRERKELQTKLRKQERKVDHLERAKRIEEVPLLKEAYEAYREDAKKFWEEEEKERIKQVIAEREYSLQHRDRILRMKEDKDSFLDTLRQARLSVYKKKLSEFEKKLDEERAKRLAERKIQRKKERREKWLEEKMAEEQRKRDEERRKEEEIKKQAEEERLAKLFASEQKQKARLQEIEERQRAKELEQEKLREESRRSQVVEKAAEADDWRKPKEDNRDPREGTVTLTKKPQGWREREQNKKESWGPKGARDTSPRNEPPLVRKPVAADEGSWRVKPAQSATDEPPAKDSFSRGGERSEGRYQPPVRRAPPGEDGRLGKPAGDREDFRRPDRDDYRRSDRDDNRRSDREDFRRPTAEREDFRRSDRPPAERSDREDFRRPTAERSDREDFRRPDREDFRRTDREDFRRSDRDDDRDGADRRGMGGRDSGRGGSSYAERSDRNFGDRPKRNFGDSERGERGGGGGFGSRDYRGGGGGGGGYNKDRLEDKVRSMKPPLKERSEESGSWRREPAKKDRGPEKSETPKREKPNRNIEKSSNDGADDGWQTVSKR